MSSTTRPAGAPVRVLLLIKGLGPGGAEQLIVNQVQVRDRERFEMEAAYLVPWKHHHVDALEQMGVPTTCLEAPREWDLRWVGRLRTLLRRGHFDVVHVHSPYVASLTRLVLLTLPRRTRPRLVYTEHNRWPRHATATRWLNRATMGLDAADIAVAEDVRQTIPPRLRRRVRTLQHGTDLAAVAAAAEERDAVRAELGIEPGEVVVGTVANYRREKAYDDLLVAAAKALSDEPTLRIVAVGQGPLQEEIERLHADLGLGDRCLLLGYRPDAIRVMSAYDLFTLASRHEGLPVALMDALAMGLPVVATEVGGIPQAIHPDVEGLLVPSGEPDRLAAAWVALARDPDRRARLATAARHAGADYDIAHAARTLEELYLELAAGRPMSPVPAAAATDRYLRAPGVLDRSVLGGVLLLARRGEGVVALLGSAAAIWELLESPQGAEDLVTALWADYEADPGTIRVGVEDALASLVTRELVLRVAR